MRNVENLAAKDSQPYFGITTEELPSERVRGHSIDISAYLMDPGNIDAPKMLVGDRQFADKMVGDSYYYKHSEFGEITYNRLRLFEDVMFQTAKIGMPNNPIANARQGEIKPNLNFLTLKRKLITWH